MGYAMSDSLWPMADGRRPTGEENERKFIQPPTNLLATVLVEGIITCLDEHVFVTDKGYSYRLD